MVIDRSSDGTTVDYLNGPGVDNKLRQTSATTGSLYFIQDHLGSTVALTNASGTVVERLQYEASGDSTGSGLTRYGYSGRERDPLTGLIYNRARWYDPQQGRFISEDPSGFDGGLNKYLYADAEPINSVDPFGLQTVGPSRNPGNFPNTYPVCKVPTGGRGIEFLPNHDIIGAKHRDRIINAFKRMLENCECRQAFTDAGVDLGDVWNKGVLIGSDSLLTDSSISDAQVKLTPAERAKASKLVNKNNAFTGMGSSFDSRPHIFYGFDAHNEGLIRVLAHELIHAGGVGGKPQNAFWSALGWDDLDYLGHKYRNVLAKCGGL